MKNYFLSVLFILFALVGCNQQPKLKPLKQGDVILAFGDSLTYGTGASSNMNYPTILELLTGYHVINAGVPGEETEQGKMRIYSALDENTPALVIVCLGGNDLLRKRQHIVIKENLKTIIKTIQGRGIQVVVIAVPEPTLRLRIPTFYAEVGSELKVPVEELALARLLGDQKYKSDYIHLNNQGYSVMALEIANFLQKQGAIKSVKTP